VTSTWTNRDFDLLGWHDVHVHALRILGGEHGAGELWLDLDYILEWIPPDTAEGSYRFRVAPALLKFHDVTSLQLSLDYATWGAAMGPFSIDGIQREPIPYPDNYVSFRWAISVNWPAGKIMFQSPGFTQVLTGPVVDTGSQDLTESEREGGSPIN
jgi:hypothetical protein